MINKIKLVIKPDILFKDLKLIIQPVFKGFTIGAFSLKRSLHRKLDTLVNKVE